MIERDSRRSAFFIPGNAEFLGTYDDNRGATRRFPVFWRTEPSVAPVAINVLNRSASSSDNIVLIVIPHRTLNRLRSRSIHSRRAFQKFGASAVNARLGPRVRILINIEHSFICNVRVNLCRREAAMSQEFLNAAEICAPIEQVSREAVSQGVGARLGSEPVD